MNEKKIGATISYRLISSVFRDCNCMVTLQINNLANLRSFYTQINIFNSLKTILQYLFVFPNCGSVQYCELKINMYFVVLKLPCGWECCLDETKFPSSLRLALFLDFLLQLAQKVTLSVNFLALFETI